MAREIEKGDKIIDSRDVYKKMCGMEDELVSLRDAVETAKQHLNEAIDDDLPDAQDDFDAAELALKEWEDEYGEEFNELAAFDGDIPAQETLIHENYFETYARELADDIGAINKDMAWPATCIDWKQAAEELQHDYSSAEWGDHTYYYRG